MRRFSIFMIGVLALSMLTACSPTKVDDSLRPETSFSPETNPPVVIDRTPDPNLPALEMMFVYRSNSDATELERVQVNEEEMNEQVLLDKLIEFGVLDEGTEILSFEVVGDIPMGPGAPAGASGGERIGTLDLSQVPTSLGTDAEIMMLGAVGNTFIENYELDKLKLLVNGANYESGHIVHGDDDYLEYDTEYVNTVDEEETEEDPGWGMLEEVDEEEETTAQ